MKHLVWIFLAVFCTTLAQVQPVALPLVKGGACCCCENLAGTTACAHHSSGGMDDCATCVTCGTALNLLLPGIEILSAARLTELSRLHWSAETGLEITYPPLLTPPRLIG